MQRIDSTPRVDPPVFNAHWKMLNLNEHTQKDRTDCGNGCNIHRRFMLGIGRKF